MLEEITGLPINMRRAKCPVAIGSTGAMNLLVVATGFFREHCVGCDRRRSTGEVPNLATLVADEDSAAAAEKAAEAKREDAAHALWAEREDARRTLSVGSDEVMAAAVADIGLLDPDPAAESDLNVRKGALARLNALADGVPELFTRDVIAAACTLVVSTDIGGTLLEPLRRVAIRRPAFGAHVAAAAVAELRRRASVPAGRCLADLSNHLVLEEIDDAVCRAAIELAGGVSRIPHQTDSVSKDPVALLTLADLVPERLVTVVSAMFPAPRLPRSLILLSPPPAGHENALYDVAAAAGAVRALAPTHSHLADQLLPGLIRHQAGDSEALLEDDPARPFVERALAVCVVLGVGNVVSEIDEAARRARGFSGQRFVRVLELAVDLAFAEPRWRDPGDPRPDAPQRTKLTDAIFGLALKCLSGAWGDDARSDAAELIKDVANDDPKYTLERLPALLGAFLSILEESKKPQVSPLEILTENTRPMIQGLERMNRRTAFRSAMYRTLEAVERTAQADPVTVCSALVSLIDDERDSARHSDIAWHLLKFLGRIGSRHGNEFHVIQTVLPTLYTYILGSEPLLRAEALDAWSEIGRSYSLPSSLADLLPALIGDKLVVVAAAVTRAAMRLTWTPDQTRTLLQAALKVMAGVDLVKNKDVVKESARAVKALARRLANDRLCAWAEEQVLNVVEPLVSYDLADVLDRSGDWTRKVTVSPEMAMLRLRQAADPTINDRFNVHDDDELCDLLSCGAGLINLPLAHLTEAAVGQGPDRPLAAAEFVEVAWRAGRIGDARAILGVLLAQTPDEQAYADHRAILSTLASAVDVDAEAEAGKDCTLAADAAAAAASALRDKHGEDLATILAASVSANARVKRALVAGGRIGGTDPVATLEAQAAELSAAGADLATASAHATPTAGYLRAFASACEVGAHLLRAEAAAFDARMADRSAHKEASDRRGHLIAEDLRTRFGDDDPLAGPLRVQLYAAASGSAGAATASTLDGLAKLPLPVPVVAGMRQRQGPADLGPDPHGTTPSLALENDGPPVAVALASIDGNLVTGPEVLRGGRVYELSMRVQTGIWPAWADRLDAEFISHMTEDEIIKPVFEWKKVDHAGDGETYEQSGSLVLKFAVTAGRPAPPMLLRLTWRGKLDGEPKNQALDVAGHRELRVRPYDATRDRATEYPVFDERLLAMYDRFAKAGYDHDHLQAFCRLMTAICRAGLSMTWEKKYRRGVYVKEREFHNDLHDRLVQDPELGGRVERGTPLALGFLDVLT
ncbi:hypothetical protein J7I84_19820 [Arthrobacter sp. ISL-85]|uniref:hypothetical protein n=1 Tax=Arthrobacter sp. ISL-85 TaxID=2819115 RepID=UPI001BEA734B|nr:hypothetical protein [Arthrobacter sp. ISL-85]MBT2568695.1 hypothetical protein [Arthrobacter sp. ISL-85]